MPRCLTVVASARSTDFHLRVLWTGFSCVSVWIFTYVSLPWPRLPFCAVFSYKFVHALPLFGCFRRFLPSKLPRFGELHSSLASLWLHRDDTIDNPPILSKFGAFSDTGLSAESSVIVIRVAKWTSPWAVDRSYEVRGYVHTLFSFKKLWWNFPVFHLWEVSYVQRGLGVFPISLYLFVSLFFLFSYRLLL